MRQFPCISQSRHTERPAIKEYAPEFCGHTLFIDAFYPVEGSRGIKQSKPFLIITCGISRILLCKPLPRLLPDVIIDIIVEGLFSLYGRCYVIISDKGPGFVGPQWGEFCNIYGVAHIGVAAVASHSNGMVGRQVGILKEGYRVCKEIHPLRNGGKVLRRVRLARNIAPQLTSGVSPLDAMTGRSDLLAALDDTSSRHPPDLSVSSEDMPHTDHHSR